MIRQARWNWNPTKDPSEDFLWGPGKAKNSRSCEKLLQCSAKVSLGENLDLWFSLSPGRRPGNIKLTRSTRSPLHLLLVFRRIPHWVPAPSSLAHHLSPWLPANTYSIDPSSLTSGSTMFGSIALQVPVLFWLVQHLIPRLSANTSLIDPLLLASGSTLSGKSKYLHLFDRRIFQLHDQFISSHHIRIKEVQYIGVPIWFLTFWTLSPFEFFLYMLLLCLYITCLYLNTFNVLLSHCSMRNFSATLFLIYILTLF